MNNNPNKVPSDKKAVLNFNADVWNVDMPIARRPVNNVQTPMTNSVPRVAGGMNMAGANYQNSVSTVNNQYNSMSSINTVGTNEPSKTNGSKIFGIILITIAVIGVLLYAASEMGLISLSMSENLSEMLTTFSDETISNLKFI